MKKTVMLLMAAMAVMAVPACAAETDSTAMEETQNPVMNFVGSYGYSRANMDIECDGENNARVFVTWGASAWERGEWEMSGPFDPETLTVSYDNCIKKMVAFNDDGDIDSEEVVYENGTGSISFIDEDGPALTWTDDQENIAEDAVFTYVYPLTEDMTEAIGEAEGDEDADIQMAHGNIDSEITDGVLTIRIGATDHDDPAMHWEAYRGDKGDRSLVEVITETDMEDGLAYAGSFRVIPDQGDGDDYVRLVYTDGHYNAEYLDWNVKVENGAIVEVTGGSQAFPSSGSDLAQVMEGVWEEEDGSRSLEVSLDDDGTLAFTISDGAGRDGITTFFTMHVYYDAIKEALVYWDGEEHTAAITDGSEETMKETEATESQAPEDAALGTGIFGIEDGEDGRLYLTWRDDTFGNIDGARFVKD